MPELRKLKIDTLDYPNNDYRVWLKPAASAPQGS